MKAKDPHPGHFGKGVVGDETVVEELARVKALEKLLGPAGVAAVGLPYAQTLYDAIIDQQGVLPVFRGVGITSGGSGIHPDAYQISHGPST